MNKDKVEKINYELIEDLIKSNFYEVMDENYNFYDKNKILITTDLQIIKNKNKGPRMIYVVIQFSPAEINFGQTVLPVSITAISEQNKLNVCKQLLIDYSQKFNMAKSEDGTIYQIYTSPQVESSFQDLFEGQRSIISLEGTFIISETASFFELNYHPNENDEEYVEFVNGQIDYNAQLDTQPFFNLKNFTKSEVKFSTLSFTITTFAVSDNVLIRDIIKTVLKKESNNKTFNFDVSFLNIEEINDNFKLINFSASQRIADMPMIVATFTN
jgi:hypothetical protein